MYELMKELDGMSDEQKYTVMSDYTSLFDEQTEMGRTEDEIISKLLSPKEIAEGYRSGTPVPLELFTSHDEDQLPAFKRVLKFILLIPCAVVIVPLAALAGAALAALSLALCAASVALSVYSFAAVNLSFGFFITGVGGIVFTFSFIMLCVAFVQLTAKMTAWFPKYMGKVLKDGSVKSL